MTRLFIRLLPDGASHWLLGGRGGRRGQGLPAAALAQGADEVVLIVPSETVLLLAAPRISTRRDELERGLAFALEERLAAPVESLLVVPGESQAEATVPALVVERSRLDAWLEALSSAGLVPDRVLPESALLDARGGPLLWMDGSRFVLRLDVASAYAGNLSELDAILARAPAPPARVLCCGDQTVPLSLATAGCERVDDALAALSDGIESASALNLLGGDYAGRRRQHGAGRRVWAWAASIAAAAIALMLLGDALELRALRQRNTELQSQMEALYRDLVPEANRVVDPEAQLADVLARLQGRGDGGALPLLARIAPALGEGRFALDLVDIREDHLELVVRGPDLAALDALRESLSRQLGMAVELGSAVPGKGEVEGRFRIRGGGA